MFETTTFLSVRWLLTVVSGREKACRDARRGSLQNSKSIDYAGRGPAEISELCNRSGKKLALYYMGDIVRVSLRSKAAGNKIIVGGGTSVNIFQTKPRFYREYGKWRSSGWNESRRRERLPTSDLCGTDDCLSRNLENEPNFSSE